MTDRCDWLDWLDQSLAQSNGAEAMVRDVLGPLLDYDARHHGDLVRTVAVLGRAADMLDASGLVVWLGTPTGSDLRPVLAHGYSDQALARMPTVPRSADNAAAAAYRSSTLQIVLSRPGSTAGAVVAPLLGPDGCIGALSAEIASGGEGSEAVQALATLFAAQLAAVLAAPPQPAHAKAVSS